MKPRTALAIAWALFGLIVGIFMIFGAFAGENLYVICEGDVCGMKRDVGLATQRIRPAGQAGREGVHMSKLLTDADFQRAADTLECDVAAIKAVCEIEAPRGGFLPSSQPVILFEAHHFHRLTAGKFTDSHPHISSRTWNRVLYKGGQAEHARLTEAAALDRDAALQSASWGKFQIMGFNWYACGYSSLQNFINAMYRDEGAHLDAFVGFVKANRLDAALREHRWADFARGYNGAGYAANQYDTKLAAAWRKWGGQA